MRALAVLLAASVAMAQKPQPAATVSQLMADMIYPASNAIFYISRAAPKTPQEWSQIRLDSLTLAEAGNLLTLPGRARDQAGWMSDAKLLADAGAAAYKLAQAKDYDGLVALNDQLYQSCIQCHEDYRPNYRRRK